MIHNYVNVMYLNLLQITADSHRVLLKGEHPDYINATFVNVSGEASLPHSIHIMHTLHCTYVCRATSRRRPTSLLKAPCSQPAGTSGRWFTREGVEPLSCSRFLKRYTVHITCRYFSSLLYAIKTRNVQASEHLTRANTCTVA